MYETERLWTLSGCQRQPLIHVQFDTTIWINMVVYQWRQTTPVFFCHSLLPDRLCEHILNQQGIDIDQADLQQVQREHRQFLIRRPVAGKFSVFPINNKIIGAVPVFNDIEAHINFATQRLILQITAEEDSLYRFAQIREYLIGWMRNVKNQGAKACHRYACDWRILKLQRHQMPQNTCLSTSLRRLDPCLMNDAIHSLTDM